MPNSTSPAAHHPAGPANAGCGGLMGWRMGVMIVAIIVLVCALGHAAVVIAQALPA